MVCCLSCIVFWYSLLGKVVSMHFIHLQFASCFSGVLSLVTVHPQPVAVGKQLLPKTLGPSNVNIAPQMVSTRRDNGQMQKYINPHCIYLGSCFLRRLWGYIINYKEMHWIHVLQVFVDTLCKM